MTLESKESALSRWSRRKLKAEQVEPTPEPAPETALPLDNESDQFALASETETQPLLTDADMPSIESLTDDSDFSGFMSAGVSDELRNLALRKLFRAPVFNIRDGLDEYDEDYTSFEKLGDIVTADMKHQIEVQERKLREKLAAESEAESQQAELDALEDIDEEGIDEEGIDDEDIDDVEQPDSQTVTVASAEAQVDPDQEAENEQ